jgi:uncharacterized protein (TIGR02118 family)
MVKVSVFYPNEEGKKFDMDYYLATHIPLVRKLLGAACTNATVDHGLAGGTPGSQPTYRAVGHLHFNTVGDFVDSFTPNATQIMGDIPNYTDIAPTVQINEIKL